MTPSIAPRTPRSLALLAVVALLAALPSPAPAQRLGRESNEFTKTNPKFLAAFQPVVSKASQSVVGVLNDGKQVALGTVVAPDGLVLTKASQLGEKLQCQLAGGKIVEAKVIGIHEPNDLALLKLEAKGLVPVEWKPSKSASPGEWVASAGIEKDPTAVGVVSVGTWKLGGRATPGDSGFLGIEMAPEEGLLGVKIGSVIKGQAAEKAGLQPNDVIIGINGTPINDPDALLSTLQKYKPNDSITVKIKRGEEEKELKATLGKRPQNQFDRSSMQNSMGSELSKRRTGFPEVLQHDSVVKPTDCGNPLVDLDGKVLGVNIARAGRVESFAIPSETIQALLPDLKSGKLAPKTELAGKLGKALAEMKKAEDLLKKAEEARTLAQKKQQEVEDAFKAAKSAREQAEKAETEAKSALEKARTELKKLEEESKKEKEPDETKKDK